MPKAKKKSALSTLKKGKGPKTPTPKIKGTNRRVSKSRNIA
jgi:hypothetical protein